MASGRAASLEAHDRLAREPFLAVAEVAGAAASSRILAAAALTAEDLEEAVGAHVEETEEVAFDRGAKAPSRYRRRTRRPGLSPVGWRRSARRPGPGRRRCRNGASGSCSCGARRVANGPISRTPP